MKSLILILCFISFSLQGATMEQMQERSEKIRKFFNSLDRDSIDLCDDFYHENLKFRDPLGNIQGLEAMKSYYKKMYKNVTAIRFDIYNEIKEGNQHLIEWNMILTASSLNGGNEVTVEGNSLLRFDESTNKVIYHKDTFDMYAFIYRFVPGLGFILKKINQSLAGH